MPFLVSLVNLQKLTLWAWLEMPSMVMLAPAQNTRGLSEVMMTQPISGCSNRSRWIAS